MAGELTEVRIGAASKSLLSDQDFVRSYLRHQAWIPFGESDVVLLRIEGGYTASSTRLGIPQEYLFRVGGTQTVRGFAYQSLGFLEGDAVVGGRVMTATSRVHPLVRRFWGSLVLRCRAARPIRCPRCACRLGYGLGARWRSPVGPLALDVARGKGEPSARVIIFPSRWRSDGEHPLPAVASQQMAAVAADALRGAGGRRQAGWSPPLPDCSG